MPGQASTAAGKDTAGQFPERQMSESKIQNVNVRIHYDAQRHGYCIVRNPVTFTASSEKGMLRPWRIEISRLFATRDEAQQELPAKKRSFEISEAEMKRPGYSTAIKTMAAQTNTAWVGNEE